MAQVLIRKALTGARGVRAKECIKAVLKEQTVEMFQPDLRRSLSVETTLTERSDHRRRGLDMRTNT